MTEIENNNEPRRRRRRPASVIRLGSTKKTDMTPSDAAVLLAPLGLRRSVLDDDLYYLRDDPLRRSGSTSGDPDRPPEIRIDLRRGSPEIPSRNLVRVSDFDHAQILQRVRTEADSLGLRFNKTLVEEAILVSADNHHYNPFSAYFDALTWRGEDVISELASHFQLTCEIDFARTLKRWLSGAVKRALTGRQHPMLVLHGPQGKGKSQFVKWLVPAALLNHFFEGGVRPDSKDYRLSLARVFLQEVCELGATVRRQDQEALKATLTIEQVRERKPYGHFETVAIARTSFIGTVNTDTFLQDQTGNRRFDCVTIHNLDWKYTELDVDQVWAQAVQLCAQEEYVWTSEEAALRDYKNLDYEVEDPVEIFLEGHLVKDPTGFVFTDDLLRSLHQSGIQKHKGTTSALAAAIKKLFPEAARAVGRTETKQQARGYRGVSHPSVNSVFK